MFAALLNWLRSLLWNKQADIALIGLQNSGKVRFLLPSSPPPFSFYTLLQGEGEGEGEPS